VTASPEQKTEEQKRRAHMDTANYLAEQLGANAGNPRRQPNFQDSSGVRNMVWLAMVGSHSYRVPCDP
jgi:hypothetical protein